MNNAKQYLQVVEFGAWIVVWVCMNTNTTFAFAADVFGFWIINNAAQALLLYKQTIDLNKFNKFEQMIAQSIEVWN